MAAEVICFTGMTFDEVDNQLTLERYNSLARFWRKHPPMAVLLAKYVGYEAPAEVVDTDVGDGEEMDEESMSALASVFGLPVRNKGASTNDGSSG